MPPSGSVASLSRLRPFDDNTVDMRLSESPTHLIASHLDRSARQGSQDSLSDGSSDSALSAEGASGLNGGVSSGVNGTSGDANGSDGPADGSDDWSSVRAVDAEFPAVDTLDESPTGGASGAEGGAAEDQIFAWSRARPSSERSGTPTASESSGEIVPRAGPGTLPRLLGSPAR